jgi:dienelactone hydrolase
VRRSHAAIGALIVLALAGCTIAVATRGGGLPEAPPGAVAARKLGLAPTRPLAVGVTQFTFQRGGRTLRTLVLYPSTGAAGGLPKSNGPVAAGRFPLVLFSHGLHSSPESYRDITAKIAAAGFVVAAPAYPFTNKKADPFVQADMPNQPADASFVITEVLKLDVKSGAPLAGHIETSKVGAAGHSAGGYTTTLMLSGPSRDMRLKAAIIVAGGDDVVGEHVDFPFSGAVTPVLFVHGDHDAVVPYTNDRNLYARCAWPKGFLTVLGGDHGAALLGTGQAAGAVGRTIVEFLRYSLYDDGAAGEQLRANAKVAGITAYEGTL